MFTISCTTCEAKLVVKDASLNGKIVACPNCGKMVLVQFPDPTPTPTPLPPPLSVVHRRFPDVLSHRSSSAIIGHVSEEERLSDILLEAVPESAVPETEIKTRKILIGILLGLLISLLVILGFLMMFHQTSAPPMPVEEPVIPAPPVEPDESDFVPEPVPGEVSLPADEVPEEIPFQEFPAEPAEILDEEDQMQHESDTLSAFEQKMPGFVDLSVPNIDIEAKLALPILELDFKQQRLIGFLRDISRLTEIPMTLDIDEMNARSLSAQTPVTGQFRDATVGQILTETLAALDLQWKIADRQILIFPAATDETVDLTFDVADFEESPEVLAGMIQQLVVPDATITAANDRLTVVPNASNPKSPRRQRHEILRLLEQLRALRHLPPTTDWPDHALEPEAFGWHHVTEPMTLNHYQPVPLSRVLTQLESLTGLTILVDHQSLHRSLSSFASLQATVLCDDGTVNDVLELALASVDSVTLAYRIIDAQTLEITTAESVRQPIKMTVEIHPYPIREDETPEEIVRLLRSTVAPETWATGSMESKTGGNIVIDEPSRCLFIRQSQPVQRQLLILRQDIPSEFTQATE